MTWAFTKATALIENDSERLSAEEMDMLLDDASSRATASTIASLLHWFNETDAWWFDNVRFNRRGVWTRRTNVRSARRWARWSAITFFRLGPTAGTCASLCRCRACSYSFPRAFPFPATTLSAAKPPTRKCAPSSPSVAMVIMLLRCLPVPSSRSRREPVRWPGAVERLLGDDFGMNSSGCELGELWASRSEQTATTLDLLEDLLHTAAHHAWAIAHTENGFITTEMNWPRLSARRAKGRARDLHQRFSGLLGVRAAIVTATSWREDLIGRAKFGVGFRPPHHLFRRATKR